MQNTARNTAMNKQTIVPAGENELDEIEKLLMEDQKLDSKKSKGNKEDVF